MPDYTWITFDCYGTLIDWEHGICSAFEKIAMTSGVPFERRRLLSLYHKYEKEEEHQYRKYRDILTRLARRISIEMGYSTHSYDFLVESLQRWRPFPDTNHALTRLARNHKLGILSNVDNDLIALTRRHFSVSFDLVITAENVSSYKPNQAHFLEARSKIGTGPWIHAAQSYFHDIVPCAQLGIDSAWINRSQEHATDPQIQPRFNGSDLERFANWIEGIDSSPNLFGN